MADSTNSLCEALRLTRVYHDLNQTELARELGMSRSNLCEIEAGKTMPSLALLEKYSKRFDIPVSSIMFFAENKARGDLTGDFRRSIAKKILAMLDWIACLDSK